MAVTPAGTRDIAVADLARFPGNARRGNVGEIRSSVRRLGQYRAIVVRDTGSGLVILAGNHTADALQAEGHETVRCEVITCTDDEARRVNLADNRLADLAEDDTQALAELLAALDGDLDGTGYSVHDLDDIADLLGRDESGGGEGSGHGDGPEDRPSLADRFLIPPFDVLDSRQGWWRDRKRAWADLGLKSEVGRDGSLIDFSAAADRGPSRLKTDATEGGTVSIFDPVLCELAYRWFCPREGTVIDPFAGGSVRGLMAAMTGRRYIGNDLSADQVKANMEQADDFAARRLINREAVTWAIGDSAEWVSDLMPDSADFILACPPYLWLERYSDDPADLSGMGEAAFEDTYTHILKGVAAALRPDRFAVIVTGDVRDDKTGRLVDFRAMTVRAAASAGLMFASGAVLVTSVGSLPIRAPRMFEGARTLGRTHQDVSVFCKGSRQRAAKACGKVDLYLPDEVTEAWGDDSQTA